MGKAGIREGFRPLVRDTLVPSLLCYTASLVKVGCLLHQRARMSGLSPFGLLPQGQHSTPSALGDLSKRNHL